MSIDASFAERIQVLLIQMLPFLMAVVFHEYAHGYIANKCGDPTAKDGGRLTLNPLPHLDPIGTVLFPVINMLTGMNLLFGWAKPVPINPARFKNYKKGMVMVALAGPGMNFFLATISSIVFVGLHIFLPKDFYLFVPLAHMAEISVGLNFALGLFNLLPLPPLDGSRVISVFLPYNAARSYDNFAQYSFFILIGLLMFNVLDRLIGVPVMFLTRMVLGGSIQLFSSLGLIH